MLHHPLMTRRHAFVRVGIILVFIFSSLLLMLPAESPVEAQAPPPELCYTVADGGEALWQVNPTTGATSRIGSLGGLFTEVEAITLNLDASILYAVHDDVANDAGIFGRINVTTGAFSAIGVIGPGSGIDPGTGSATTDPLADVDSLSVHPLTGDYWGITQDRRENKIFRINPSTGAVIPDTFGPGLDYVQIVLPPAQTDTDDLGIDPVTGEFYVVGNNSGGDDNLFRLNINGFDPPSSPGLNASLGTLSAVQIGPFELSGSPGTFIVDMEGFSFYNDGTFFGTTGGEGGVWSDYMWEINTTTGVVSAVTPGPIDDDGVPPSNGDFESVACLSGGANIKTGIVFEDVDGNGVLDGTDIPYAGATVRFYRDNGNGTFDGAPTDTLVQAVTTGAGGVYTFQVAVEGTYFAVLDSATLPAGTTLTGVGVYTVNFVAFGNTLVNNHFGFWTEPDPTQPPDPTLPPDPTDVLTAVPTSVLTPGAPAGGTPVSGNLALIKRAQPSVVLPGEQVTFTIIATNPTGSALTGVVITDTLDAAFFDAILELSTTKGTTAITGPLSATVTIGTLAPGETVTVTILARVRGDITGAKDTQNVALMVSNETDPIAAQAVVALITLPNTGYPPSGTVDQSTVLLQVARLGVLIALLAGVLLGAAWWRRSRAF